MMSVTDVAFAMAATLQLVVGVVWLLGAWVIGDTRRAAVHWAAFALCGGLSFVFWMVALHTDAGTPAEGLRAIGNVSAIVALMALQRGLWLFTDQPQRFWLHRGLFLAVVCVAVLGLDPSFGRWRMTINSLVLAFLFFDAARDLARHLRGQTQSRARWWLVLPLVLGGLVLLLRAARAMLTPDALALELAANSLLNVSSAFGYVVLTLAFHAVLMGLVVSQLLGRMRDLSRTDGLTGLLNRRAMEDALTAQIDRSQRSGETFAVLVLDLDHFKLVNDTHGHQAGDLALRHAAALFKAALRPLDQMARFGGEEFLVLLPGTGAAPALEFAERLCRELNASPLALADKKIVMQTSIGLAEWQGEDLDALFLRADAALYEAKRQGRNRAVLATTPDSGPRRLHATRS